THVWNYAQAIPHLFPDLERSLRQTEFNESQDDRGHQTFRSGLPIRPVAHTFHAASDGQLGGIMKVYRDWRICGDTAWLKSLWPRVRQSLEYCMATWDPKGKGILEEPHHNTYDIEFWGPDGMCTSFYLGALAAAVEMGTALDADVTQYSTLLAKGRSFLESDLFNGEYYIQKIQTEGLEAEFKPLDYSSNGSGYEGIMDTLNREGPKYQYGTGCLSDGVLGFWIARTAGLGEITDAEKVKSHLRAVHRYNLKHDLTQHANPQRPSFAMGGDGGLLLCTWPRGDALSLPFVYSNEVWTGIEYQVASHLMFEGLVEEGLEVVRVCRDRYDGTVRNPFNEYECGHWYARALSSYGLLQGLTGVRYDAVDKALYIDSRVGENFRTFLSTATGFGTVGLKAGRPFVEVKGGEIDIRHVYVSGSEMTF
ncbi:GH116 family glycosyl hydrolase, partial [Acidobacteriota bacterium]